VVIARCEGGNAGTILEGGKGSMKGDVKRKFSSDDWSPTLWLASSPL
jgi:hypothetical protein